MVTKQPLKEALCSSTIAPGLKIHIYHLAILVDGPPKVVPLAVDLDKNFIDEEGIAVSPVFSFQASGVEGSEFDTPETHGFMADGYAPLSQKIFYISIAQIQPIVEPNGITDDVGWKSMAFVDIHTPILPISAI